MNKRGKAMDKVSKTALRLADAVIGALAAGNEYNEMMNEYDCRIATKRQAQALARTEKKWLKLSDKACLMAESVKQMLAAQ